MVQERVEVWDSCRYEITDKNESKWIIYIKGKHVLIKLKQGEKKLAVLQKKEYGLSRLFRFDDAKIPECFSNCKVGV